MPDLTLVLVRSVHLGACALLVGIFGFLLLVARPALRADPEHEGELGRIDTALLRASAWAVAVATASHVVWLWLQTASMAGVPILSRSPLDALGRALAETQFGRVWIIRLLLLLLLGAFVLLRQRERETRDWIALRFEALLLGGASLVTLAWAGHAAATEGPDRFVHVAADALHLLVSGLWLGGLLPLALVLAMTRHGGDPPSLAAGLVAARRFSCLALFAVGVVIVSGVVNAWFLVGDVPRLIGTRYGTFLLLKLALLASLIPIAAANRHLVPARGAREPGGNPARASARVLALRRGVAVELMIGAAILLAVGLLGVTPPARHEQSWWPLPFRLSWTATSDTPGIHLWLAGGALFATLGALALLGGALRRFGRRWALPGGFAMVAYGAWLALSPMAIDAYPTTYVRPATPYHALSIANGTRLYREHCAVCHGVAGYGDGPGARGLAKPPADLTARHTADHTAGDLYWWLTHGIPAGPMPGFGDRLTDEDRWDVINFLRALASAEQARTLSPVVTPPQIVAPDFTYGVGVGPGGTLKEHRGWAMVHLVLVTLPGSVERLVEIDREWARLGRAGARVVAVPMREAEDVYRRLGGHAPNIPVVVEGSEEIVAAYTMFRRTQGIPGEPPVPDHLELLIDRQGYIRARWIPGTDGRGWADVNGLVSEIERLDRETPSAPAPDEHVH